MNFINAVHDCRLLKNRSYPDKAALKLVGDRYRLSTVARNCLRRGVVETGVGRSRRGKKIGVKAVGGRDLGIDWYNVLITLESYFKGALLFLADDGVLRDSSAVHGSYRTGPHTERAIDLIAAALVRLKPRRVDVYIDSPISHSQAMRESVAERLDSLACPGSAALLASADYALKSYPAVVASSDSVIIDSCRAWIDLPRLILEREFSFRPAALEALPL